MQADTAPKRILVTGATGRSGRVFLSQLADLREAEGALPFSVTVVARDPSRVHLSAPEVKVVKGDLEDPNFLQQAVRGHDTLLHIAGIHLSASLVEAAVAAHDGPRWLILVHTSGIYSRFKAAGEYYRMVEADIADTTAGVPCDITLLRPTMVYGAQNDGTMSVFIRLVDRLRIFPLIGDGRTPIRPVRDADLGRAYLKVLLNHAVTRGKVYDLSGGESIEFIDIFRTISRKLGKRTWFVPVPPRLAYAAAVALRALTLRRIDLRERVLRMTEPRIYSNSRAVEDFGYDPVDFATGIAPEIAEYLRRRNRRARQP